jgi:hypothetical protein
VRAAGWRGRGRPSPGGSCAQRLVLPVTRDAAAQVNENAARLQKLYRNTLPRLRANRGAGRAIRPAPRPRSNSVASEQISAAVVPIQCYAKRSSGCGRAPAAAIALKLLPPLSRREQRKCHSVKGRLALDRNARLRTGQCWRCRRCVSEGKISQYVARVPKVVLI